MKTEKVMAVFAALLFALSMVGVAYAAWYDSVNIKAEVHMGELIVGWNSTSLSVVETTNGVPEEDFVPDPKPWVANTTVVFKVPETSVHLDPPKTVHKEMHITVENAYPQYDVHLDVDLTNGGTIPACIYKDFALYFYDVKDDQELSFELAAGYPKFDGSKYEVQGAIVDPVVGPIINFNFTIWDDQESLQIDECESDLVEIDIDFKQEAEECHTYTFEVTILAIQWNKLHEASIYAP